MLGGRARDPNSAALFAVWSDAANDQGGYRLYGEAAAHPCFRLEGFPHSDAWRWGWLSSYPQPFPHLASRVIHRLIPSARRTSRVANDHMFHVKPVSGVEAARHPRLQHRPAWGRPSWQALTDAAATFAGHRAMVSEPRYDAWTGGRAHAPDHASAPFSWRRRPETKRGRARVVSLPYACPGALREARTIPGSSALVGSDHSVVRNDHVCDFEGTSH